MMYRFAFNRIRLIGLLSCLVILGLLTYIAGVITGIGLWMPTRAELALLKSNPHGTANAAAVARARLPGAAPAAQASAALAEKTTAATAPAAAPAAPPAAPANPSPFAAMAATLPAPAAAPSAAAPEEDVFSVQLGAFREPKNAQQLMADLKQKGYPATIFTALDEDQREWNVVRIGGFKTLESASRAAASFTSKERLQALIRRSSAL